MIHKKTLNLVFISILLFLSSSIGFDAYTHTSAYYFVDYEYDWAYNFFDELVIRRYILLSYIYRLSALYGIPLGIILIFLISLPLYAIYYSLNTKYSFKNEYTLINLGLLFVTLYFTFYFSGTNIAILWLIAYFLTNRKIFILGAFFHPAGLIIFYSYIILFSRKHLAVLLFFTFLIVSLIYFDTQYQILTSKDLILLRFNINEESLYQMILRLIDAKRVELTFAAIIILFVIFNYRLFINKSNLQFIIKKGSFFSLNKSTTILIVFIISLIGIYYMTFLNDVSNLYSYLFLGDKNVLIYITWFDWGNRDIDMPINVLLNLLWNNNS